MVLAGPYTPTLHHYNECESRGDYCNDVVAQAQICLQMTGDLRHTQIVKALTDCVRGHGVRLYRVK